ncbi:MAG: hypothetical protein ABIJ57_00400 [Pseudomonadota bacterium]|uniref:Uncharacterized protein n=1 Tax=viral metagenome TaxID=1070528 RepID=A0A6M3KWY1_9ZZZZ
MSELDGGNIGDAGGSGADQKPSWLASLPDDLKSNEVLARFPTIGDASKALVSYKTSEGKMVAIPGEDATPEQRAAFYQKLGRPETADKYTITKPEGLPEGIAYSPEVETAFKSFAFEQGISDAQAKGIYDWYWGLVKDGQAKAEADQLKATETAINGLKDEWKGDAYKVNTELAKRAWKEFNDKPEDAVLLDKLVDGVRLGDHPAFLRKFAAIGKALGNDSLGGRDGGGDEMSDEDKAKARFPNTYKK